MMEIPKVYKALVETGDGRLVSIWAGNSAGEELEYKEGQITYSPKDSMGIFASDTLEDAKENALGNGGCKVRKFLGYLTVYEAIPLGEMLTKDDERGFHEYDRYPAILLGKEVWSNKPEEKPEEKPKEEWVEISAECTAELYHNRDGECLFILNHNGSYVIEIGNEGKAWRASGYEVRTTSDNGVVSWFRVYKRIQS